MWYYLRIFITILIVACLLVYCAPPKQAYAYTLKNLSINQEMCIRLAYKYGQRIEYRGQRYGETVASILLQESHANRKVFQKNGVVIGDKDKRGYPKSLGPMQMQLPTARDLERWMPHVFENKFGPFSPTDEELIIALLTDIDFNIQMGAAYFEYLLNKKGSWSKAILAYNRGPGGTGDPENYMAKVKQWRLDIVLPFLRKMENKG
jgi:hypothetical protein